MWANGRPLKEREAGRIAGPFTVRPFPIFHCSPLGIVPKKDPSEFRLIHHLSYPHGSSVNDFIPDDCSPVSYASINDAIDILKLACSAGVFFGCAICSRKCHVETSGREEEMGRVKRSGEGAGREKRKRLPENTVKMRNTP